MTFEALKRHIIAIIVLIVLFISTVACIYLIYGKIKDVEKLNLLFEIAKSLIYLAIVMIIGAGVAALVKSFEKSLRRDRTLHELKKEFLDKLHSIYQEVENSLLNLKSAGLIDIKSAAVFRSEQITEYENEMKVLIATQRKIQILRHELEYASDLFSKKSQEIIVTTLKIMDEYLDNLVNEYVVMRPKLYSAMESTFLSTFNHLLDFTGDKDTGTFNKHFFSSYIEAQGLVRAELLDIKKVVSIARP